VGRLSAAARVLVRFQISEQGPLVRTTAWNALHQNCERIRSADSIVSPKSSASHRRGNARRNNPALDSGIAAQQVAGMINAASRTRALVPDIAHENAVRLFAQPLFEGILSPGGGRRSAHLLGCELVNEHR